MRVKLLPADLGGCGYYRLIWPGKAAQDRGYDVEIVDPVSSEADIKALWSDEVDIATGSKVATHLVDVVDPSCDVVVIQRPLTRHLAQAIPLLRRYCKVVVEIDDDFHSISRRNVSWAATNPAASPDRNWAHLMRACQEADRVTVTTPALARRYNGAVVPNCVPERYLKVEHEHSDYIGWTGSVETHPDDLQVTHGAIQRVLNKSEGWRVAIVGTGAGVQLRLGLSDPPPSSGWVSLENYPEMMAQIGVGIVPLEDTAFNQAKSWLKGLEFAALGVPFVASATQPYLELERLGMGRTAKNPRQWESALLALTSDRDAREKMSESGREAASRWTIEGNVERWMRAWTTW